MTSTPPVDWSPADNPYAIAASQAQMWRAAVQLTVLRMRDDDDHRVGWSSRQLDAHFLIMGLRQLLTAEQLEQDALETLGVDPAVGQALGTARQKFEQDLPGIKTMRDGLMHFDQWSRGEGHGPQRHRRKAGDEPRDIARDDWRFDFSPASGAVTFGTYAIDVAMAVAAASKLCAAICTAAHEVDKKGTEARRAKALNALSAAGISSNAAGALLRVTSGIDLHVWLSLAVDNGSNESVRRQVAQQVTDALSTVGLRLEPAGQVQPRDSVELLARGISLCVIDCAP